MISSSSVIRRCHRQINTNLFPFSSSHLHRQSATSLTCRFNSTSTSSTSPPRKSNSLLNAILLGLFGASTYVLGSIYPPSLVAIAFPTPAPPRLSLDSDQGKNHVQSIEQEIMNLPIVKDLLSKSSTPFTDSKKVGDLLPGLNPSTQTPSLETPSSSEEQPHYIISRPYVKYPEQQRQHSLTAGSLRGPGLITTYPLVLSKTFHGAQMEGGNEGDSYVIIHLGRSLCGHDNVIHGGLLATIVDEALARTAFYSLPAKIGMTANLNIDYKKPVMANQFVVIKTWKVDSKDRKANVACQILPISKDLKELNGKDPYVNAKALFVQPKFAEYLNTSAVKAVLDLP